jgi:argininosuccinate lyase
LISAMVNVAERDLDLIMPGYTHLQRAQPIRWSHFILSHATSLHYARQRLSALMRDNDECELRACPLGSGALAGHPFGIDRAQLADGLPEFRYPSVNSVNSVASRDFIHDFLYCTFMISMQLSRLSEDLIIYTSAEFGMLKLSDIYSTGSSLMPQKRNPDSLELIRGKCGRIFGVMSGFMMTYKALPSSYNKDLQDDKVAMFESFDTISLLLQVTRGVITTMQVSHPSSIHTNKYQ